MLVMLRKAFFIKLDLISFLEGNLVVNKIFRQLEIKAQNILENLIFGPAFVLKLKFPKFF